MRRAWLFLLCLLTAPAHADDTMAAVAGGFYGVYAGLHPSDGIPDAAGRARYAPYLSQSLNQLLANAGAAAARFSTKNKAAPPLLEGDLFTSMFEGATSEKVGTCSGDAKAGRCGVSLVHDEAGKKATAWTDTLLLVNGPGGWRIDDIVYGGSLQFGNTGKLTDTLKSVLADTQ